MKKKFTRLACLLLAVVMLATSASAATVTVKLYKGAKALSENDIPAEADVHSLAIDYGEEATVSLNNSTVTDIFTSAPEKQEITGWKIWEYKSTGVQNPTEVGFNNRFRPGELQDAYIEPIWNDIERNFYVLKDVGAASATIADGHSIPLTLCNSDTHNFTQDGNLKLAGWPTVAAEVLEGYEIIGWKLWEAQIDGELCKIHGTDLDGTPTEYSAQGLVSYADIMHSEYEDFLLLPITEKKYWITEHPTASKPTVSTNADNTDATLGYTWYATHGKAELISPESEHCLYGEDALYTDGKWYVGADQNGLADSVNALWLREGETLTVKCGGDTAMSGAIIVTAPYDPKTDYIDTSNENYGLLIAADNKITYTAASDVAIALMPVYSNVITGQNLTTTQNDYLTFEVIDLSEVEIVVGADEKTLSEDALIGGFTYFVEVNINDMNTLTSESFYVDYEITHQPTYNKPYVETNNDDDVSEYTWYQIGEEEREEVTVVTYDKDFTCDEDGWWEVVLHAWKFGVSEFDLELGDTIRVETEGETEVKSVALYYTNDIELENKLCELEKVSVGVWETAITEDLRDVCAIATYDGANGGATDGDKQRVSIVKKIIGDILLDDETEHELSTGEDGEEYFVEVTFTDGTTLTSDIFEWETPKKSTNNSGGGLQAGGDKSTAGADKLGEPGDTDDANTQDSNAENTENTSADAGAADENDKSASASASSYTDVSENDWFGESVKYVTEKGLMNGTGGASFSPNGAVTRAMLVTVLYRNEGSPATNRSIPFGDVDMGAYYANAVVWAKQNGIVNGVSENEFAPNESVTREQIAAIMFRYAQYKGMEAVTLEENLHFDDADDISEYAVSAMNWAVGSGLIKGKTESTLNPKDSATRAEIAAILMRFIEANK